MLLVEILNFWHLGFWDVDRSPFGFLRSWYVGFLRSWLFGFEKLTAPYLRCWCFVSRNVTKLDNQSRAIHYFERCIRNVRKLKPRRGKCSRRRGTNTQTRTKRPARVWDVRSLLGMHSNLWLQQMICWKRSRRSWYVAKIFPYMGCFVRYQVEMLICYKKVHIWDQPGVLGIPSQ